VRAGNAQGRLVADHRRGELQPRWRVVHLQKEADPQQRNFDQSTEESIRGSGWNRSPSGLGCRPESTRWPLAPSGMAGTSGAAEARSRAAIVFGRWLTLVRGLVGPPRRSLQLL
jgi:hypothetical protein